MHLFAPFLPPLRGFLLLYPRPRLKPVKTVGYCLSSRWDLICAARTRPEGLAHGHHSVERQFTATVTFRSGTIDQLVYDLYGLTEVEITIVEGSLRGCMVCGFN